MDGPAVLTEYVQRSDWIAIDFGRWAAALLLFGGLVGVHDAIRSRTRTGLGTGPVRTGRDRAGRGGDRRAAGRGRNRAEMGGLPELLRHPARPRPVRPGDRPGHRRPGRLGYTAVVPAPPGSTTGRWSLTSACSPRSHDSSAWPCSPCSSWASHRRCGAAAARAIWPRRPDARPRGPPVRSTRPPAHVPPCPSNAGTGHPSRSPRLLRERNANPGPQAVRLPPIGPFASASGGADVPPWCPWRQRARLNPGRAGGPDSRSGGTGDGCRGWC